MTVVLLEQPQARNQAFAGELVELTRRLTISDSQADEIAQLLEQGLAGCQLSMREALYLIGQLVGPDGRLFARASARLLMGLHGEV